MFVTYDEPRPAVYAVEKRGDTTIFRYEPPVGPSRFGGENLARGARAVSAGGDDASAAVDGDLSTNWVCLRDDDSWLQVDLGEPRSIGRVEVWSRTGVDSIYTDAERVDMRVLAGNQPDMSDGVEIARQDAVPFPKHGGWIADVHVGGEFRYVRLERLWGMDKICSVFDMAPLGLSEFAVYAEGTGLEPHRPEQAPPEAVMLIASNGKALTRLADGRVVAEAYRFRNDQRWLIERDGEKLRILTLEGKALTAGCDTLDVAERSDEAGQLWRCEADKADWVRLTAGNGLALCLADGELALSRGAEGKALRWDIVAAYREDLPHGNTDVLKKGYGVMMHLLVGQNEIETAHERIDVTGISDQLRAGGARYLLLTTGQGSGAYLAPSEIFASIVEQDPDKRNPREDIFGRFCDELAARDIDLIAYATAFAPVADLKDFGYEMNKDDVRPFRPESVMLWSLVIREWSLRYGKKIKGWWIDGGYLFFFQDREGLLYLSNAMRSGNPDTAVAISNGIALYPNPNFENDDYTAGEVDFPFSERGWRTCYMGMVNTNLRDVPEEFRRDESNRVELGEPDEWLTPRKWPLQTEKQWFVLTALGLGWSSNGGPRKAIYDKKIWARYVGTVLKQGGAICLDCEFDPANGYRIKDYAADILDEVDRAVRLDAAGQTIRRVRPWIESLLPVAARKAAEPDWIIEDMPEELTGNPIVAFLLGLSTFDLCDVMLLLDAAGHEPADEIALCRAFEEEKQRNNALGSIRRRDYSYQEMIRVGKLEDLTARIDRILALTR
ncbi:MAG: discoidin domain-containing protein [Eubacteriales bacterium]|nr:discoidin domain-containing protein [Eubacteriales bacterium]